MKRASFIAIVLVVALLAVWATSGSAQDTPDTPAAKPDAGTPPAAAEAAPPQMPEITDAIAAFRQRDTDGAMKFLKKAVKKDPDLPPPYVILAQFFASAQMAGGMRNALEQAVKENPNDPQAYAFFADLALRDRRVTEARLLFEKADSLMLKFNVAKRKKALEPQILAGLAMTSEAREDWAGAKQYIEAWLKADPKSTDAMRQLAQCMLQQKDVQGALEVLVKACKLDPELLSPEGTVAEFYARTGNQDKAKEWVKTALNAKPRDLKTRLLATQWAFETGQLTEAERQASAALQLEPQSMDALVLRGLVALFQKNYKAAEQYFQSAHLLKPNAFPASNNLALALIEQNNEEKKQRALDYAENNARQYGKSNQASEAFATYGWVLYKLDRLDDAEKALRAATHSGTYSADTAYYMSRLLAKRGHDKEAIQLLENAIKTTAPFQNRDDAKKMAEELKK